MRTIQYPPEAIWEEITRRPQMDNATLSATVKSVLDDVRLHGDEAVKRYEERFDHVSLDTLAVSEAEMDEAERLVSSELRESLQLAHDNIHRFHAAQQFEEITCTTKPGVRCWQKSVAIERVGLYIPGGTAPLFSTVLMLATPAKIAGCREIVLCTPPNREGKVHPAILMAARIAGVSRIFKAGGVQAIGAMAYGTESIPKVYKIFGPGNQYVMAPSTCLPVLLRYAWWPTTAAVPISWPPTCCRRPSMVPTRSRCSSPPRSAYWRKWRLSWPASWPSCLAVPSPSSRSPTV